MSRHRYNRRIKVKASWSIVTHMEPPPACRALRRGRGDVLSRRLRVGEPINPLPYWFLASTNPLRACTSLPFQYTVIILNSIKDYYLLLTVARDQTLSNQCRNLWKKTRWQNTVQIVWKFAICNFAAHHACRKLKDAMKQMKLKILSLVNRFEHRFAKLSRASLTRIMIKRITNFKLPGALGTLVSGWLWFWCWFWFWSSFFWFSVFVEIPYNSSWGWVVRRRTLILLGLSSPPMLCVRLSLLQKTH